jgi:4-hydroxybenzoyl-CoA thioesterase
MRFEATRTVRFADCDPAGIVFFPQYLVMVNTLVEQWFDEALGVPYAQVIGARRTGLPTVRLEVDFTAITRHGERLTQRLVLRHLGRSSLRLHHEFLGADEPRLRATQVLVCTSLDTHRPQAIPGDLRAAMQPYLESA